MADVPSAGGGEIAGPVGPVPGTPAPDAGIPQIPDAAPTIEPAGPHDVGSDQSQEAPLDPTLTILQQRLERGFQDGENTQADGRPQQGNEPSGASEADTDPRGILEDIGAGAAEIERQDVVQAMTERETWYQHTFGERGVKPDPDESPDKRLQRVAAKRQELTDRYTSEGASRAVVDQRIAEYAQRVGADKARAEGLTAIPEGSSFRAEGSHTQIMKQAESMIQAYFNSDQGSFSGEGDLDQAGIVRTQTEQYLQLIEAGIAEGSIADDISARDVYQLVADNIAALGLQDRAATEVLLGDHGVRHLVHHNINVSQSLAQQFRERDYPMTAKDTLLLHQIMIYHDLGYAMDPVRGAMKADGVRGQDAGHALLASQYIREHLVDPTSPWHKVFNTQDFETMHRAISFHDSADTNVRQVDFTRPEGPADIEGKRRLIESIVRVADNTHAFEDKLPALLYALPDSIRYMRLLKTAGETGDNEAVAAIRERFRADIMASDGISTGDKEAFSQALDSLAPTSYKYTVGRIAGRRPEYSLEDTADGGVKVNITLTESRAHKSVVETFGMNSYGQLKKFVKDVTGEGFNEDDFNSGKVVSDSLDITVRKRGEARRESSIYEKSVMKGLKSKEFQTFLASDGDLITRDQQVEVIMNKASELSDADFAARARLIVGPSQLGDNPDRASVVEALEYTRVALSRQRRENLQAYMDRQPVN